MHDKPVSRFRSVHDSHASKKERQLAVVKRAFRRGELRQRMRDGVELGGVLAEAILGGGAWGGSLAHMGMQMGMQMGMCMELRM